MGPNTPSFQQGAQLWVGKEMAQKWIQVLGAAQSMPLDLQRQGRKALGCFFTLLPRARLPLLLEHTLPLLRFPQVWGKQQESSFLALVAATPVGSGPHSFPDFTDLRSQRAHCTILRKVGMGAGPRWRGVSGMCQRSRCSCLPRHPGWRQQERRSDVSGSLVRRLLLFFFFSPPTAVNKACQDASSQVENISEVHLAYLCFSLLERVENSKPTMKNLKLKLLLSLHFSQSAFCGFMW